MLLNSILHVDIKAEAQQGTSHGCRYKALPNKFESHYRLRTWGCAGLASSTFT